MEDTLPQLQASRPQARQLRGSAGSCSQETSMGQNMEIKEPEMKAESNPGFGGVML